MKLRLETEADGTVNQLNCPKLLISADNHFLLKGDVSQSEHKVLKLYDTLNSQSETPLLAFIEEALDKPSEPSELYLRSDGSVYQKN